MRLRPGMAAFTVLELPAVLTITALVASTAVPAFQRVIARIQVSGEINRLITSINLARSNAVRTNSPVTMCPFLVDGEGEMHCGGSYQGGWMVFVNPDKDARLDADEKMLRVFAASKERLTITNRAGTRVADDRLTYRASGRAGRTMTLLVCLRGASNDLARSVVVSNVGRPRIARNWGTCPSEE